AYFDSCLFVAGGVGVFSVNGTKFCGPALFSRVEFQGMAVSFSHLPAPQTGSHLLCPLLL
ncbi:hypothetical protein CWI45_10600, partial [Neisseria meningitidis]